MASYTVESVVGQEEWAGNNGQMITYEVLLAGEGQTVQLIRQAKSAAPSAGDTFDGTIQQTAKGPKLKLDFQGPPPGGGFQGGGNGRSDATNESIQRQTAAKAAAEMAAAVGGNGPVVLANFEEFFDAVHGKIAGDAA